MTSIGENAFTNSRFTGNLTIPNSVTSIGKKAFEYCDNFTNVYSLSETAPSLGSDVFTCTDATLHYLASAEQSYNDNGTFDGNGHVISNLSVTGSATEAVSNGLFGTLSGTVKNLGIEIFTYRSNGNDTRTDAIVGQMLNGSLVENCYVTGIDINTKVNTTGGGVGIAGCNYAGTIKNSYVHDIISINAGRAGDIAGDNCGEGNNSNGTDRPGTITNCYSSSYGGALTHGDRT